MAFPNDVPRTKVLLYLVFTLETLQTLLSSKTGFDVFVYGFLNPVSLDHIGNLWFVVPVLGGLG